MVDDACQRALELAIAANLLVEVWIHNLASGVHDVREETIRVQLKLNLQIVELGLKVQPSTPLEIKEQHASTITTRLEDIRGLMCDCTNVLE